LAEPTNEKTQHDQSERDEGEFDESGPIHVRV
jgi:hypothetical protein